MRPPKPSCPGEAHSRFKINKYGLKKPGDFIVSKGHGYPLVYIYNIGGFVLGWSSFRGRSAVTALGDKTQFWSPFCFLCTGVIQKVTLSLGLLPLPIPSFSVIRKEGKF